MVTFGSYLNEMTRIPAAGFRVTTMDTLISLFAGLLIFPLLIGLMPAKTGPELLFQTLPRLLADLDSGFFFGVAFFICLYMAALAASIGLLESVVANLLEVTKLTRAQAAWFTGFAACAVGVIPALSTSKFGNVNVRGLGFFELLDSILINGILPVSALGVSWLIARKLKRERAEEEFVNDETIATQMLYSHWSFVMKVLARGIILGSIVLALLGLLGVI
jgi:NSS family neurotransmitter:Na+ symporter